MLVDRLVMVLECHMVRVLQAVFINNSNNNFLVEITDLAINIQVLFMTKVSLVVVVVPQALQQNIDDVIIDIINIRLPKQ
jgi:hypothetical protein